jgi:hypothetical protein
MGVADKQMSVQLQQAEIRVTLANIASGSYVNSGIGLTDAKDRFMLANNNNLPGMPLSKGSDPKPTDIVIPKILPIAIDLDSFYKQKAAADDAVLDEFEVQIQQEIAAQGQAAITFSATTLANNDPSGPAPTTAAAVINGNTAATDPNSLARDAAQNFEPGMDLQTCLPQLALENNVSSFVEKLAAAATPSSSGDRHRVVTTDDGEQHYTTRLGETLRSIAVMQLNDVTLWTLIAQKNQLSTDMDAKGIPVMVLTRGTQLLMPTEAEVEIFRKSVMDPARFVEIPIDHSQHANRYIVDYSELLEPYRQRTTYDAAINSRNNPAQFEEKSEGSSTLQSQVMPEHGTHDNQHLRLAAHQPRCLAQRESVSSQSHQRLRELLRARLDNQPQQAARY